MVHLTGMMSSWPKTGHCLIKGTTQRSVLSRYYHHHQDTIVLKPLQYQIEVRMIKKVTVSFEQTISDLVPQLCREFGIVSNDPSALSTQYYLNWLSMLCM